MTYNYNTDCFTITDPDPLPPTMAIFLPAGTVKETSVNISLSSWYPNRTFSKVTVDLFGGKISAGAPGTSYNKVNKSLACEFYAGMAGRCISWQSTQTSSTQ